MLHRSRIFAGLLIIYITATFVLTFTTDYGWLIYLAPFSLLAILLRKSRFIGTVGLAAAVIIFAGYLLQARTAIGEPPLMMGHIISEPRIYGNRQQLLVADSNGTRLAVTADRYPEFEIGDEVKIEGERISIENDPYFKQNPGFYLLNRVSHTVSYGRLTSVELPQGEDRTTGRILLSLRARLIRIRTTYEAALLRILPAPQNGLAIGILLGTREYLPKGLEDLFIATGVVHIMALSGYNITIIASSLGKLIKRRVRLSTNLALLGIWLFVLSTGLTSSVVRAAIMGSMLLLARKFGRQPDSLVALLLTAAVMIALNPYIIRYDIGFQLSFAAMLGMILLAPLLASRLLPTGKKFAEILASTLAAQLFTLPLLSYYFGRVSLVGIVANLLILPFIPLVMTLVFTVGSLTLVWSWLGHKVGFVLWIFLSYIIKVGEILGSMPWAEQRYKMSPLVLLGLYLILLELVYLFSRRGVIETD